MKNFSGQFLGATGLACLFWISPAPVTADIFDCVIEPSALVSVVAAEDGIIREVAVRQGDMVTKGDVLVHLQDDIQRMQVELNEIQAGSDVEIRAARQRLALRQREFDRAEELAEKNVASGVRVEETEIELALSALALEQAEISQKLAAVQLSQARKLLERRAVRSLVDGVVMEVTADPGEYATEQVELMTIAQIDPLIIRAYLPISVYSQIEPGGLYTVAEAPPFDGVHRATAVAVDKVFDSASGTFGALLEISNEDGATPAGLRCTLDIPTPQN